MKKLFLLILILGLTSCGNRSASLPEGSATSEKDSEIQNLSFSWLLGNWERTNEEEGLLTFENWTWKTNTEYLGTAFTLKAQDTIWKESVRLIKTRTGWEYQVSTSEDPSPTIFKLTYGDPEGASFENPANEFPKVIRYFKNGNHLEAVISGGGKQVAFVFKKI